MPGPAPDDGEPVDPLTAWLLTLPADALGDLIDRRPDTRIGPPLLSLTDLGLRLRHPSGVIRAMGAVPLPGWQVLTALAALGGRATVGQITAVLRDAQEPQVRLWCDQLVEHALVVRLGDDELLGVPAALSMVGPLPGLGLPVVVVASQVPAAGLQKVVRRWGLDVPKRKAELVGAVVRQLRDESQVRRLLAEAPPQVATHLLDTARFGVESAQAAADPTSPEPDARRVTSSTAYVTRQAAIRWAVEHGLAFPHPMAYDAVMPAEVTLALGGPLVLPFDPARPTVLSVPVDEAQVTRSAHAAVADTLTAVTAVLEHVRARPASLLAAGGVGARELTRIGKAVGVPVATVRLAMEAGHACDLVQEGPDGLGPGPSLDGWRQATPASRAAALLTAWWQLPLHPTVDRDEDGKALPALGRAVALDPSIRRTVLLAAIRATSPEGGTAAQATGARALADPAALGEVFGWDDPGADVDDAELAVLWREATSWGLVALEAVTAAGCALVADDSEALLAALGEALPDVAATVRIGSDLTVVVVGIPTAGTTDLLDLVADRESRGAASTWRLSPATVRRAFDAGLDASDVLDRLRALAGSVPQPVEYLVNDVGRRYGRVAVRPASALLVVEDDGLRAELLAARSLRGLRLVPVWGAVLASSSTPAEVLAALRAGHYLPVEQDAGGAVVLASTAPARAATPERRPRVREWAAQVLAETGDDPLAGLSAHVAAERIAEPAAEPVAALVARLLDGGPPPGDHELDTVLAQVERHARRLTALESRYLAWAVRYEGAVVIDYESATGSETVRRISELELIGPHVSAWCHLRQDERYFRLDAIRAVAPG